MKLARTYRATLCTALCVAAAGFGATARAGTCTINGSSTVQAIDGFGFSSAWSGRMTTTQADVMFGTSSGQLGMSILRIRIDPNKSWGDETSNSSLAHQRGVKVFGTPWSPPPAMKTNGNVVHGSLLTSQYAAYATYLNQAISSIGLDYISLQNEPDWDPTYEGCVWTGDQFHTFMLNNASVLTKPIIMPESLNFTDSMSDPTLNDPTTAARVTFVAGHFYGNGNRVHTNAISKGKHVWETEHYFDNSDTIGAGMSLAREVSDAMNNQFSAYLWWWLNPSDASAGFMTGNTPRKSAYVLGQFGKFVRPGMSRIATTYNPTTNVYVTAYKNSSTVSVVAVNTGTSAASQTFTFQGLTTSSLTQVRTSGGENMAQQAAVTVSSGSFTVNLPAQSITTFSGPVGSAQTTYALDVTKGGTGTGTVTSSTGGINCGATCSATLDSGTSVTLTATADAGSTFGGFGGACTGTSCVLSMTAAQSVTATFTANQQQGGPISINAGGTASGSFVADADFSQGSTYSTTSAIDTSLLTGAVPPQAVLQTERYGTFTYTIPGLTAGSTYAVTLYFAESYWTAAGQRSFNVAINGSPVLTGFDIFAAAGGANKAVARSFNAVANATGQVVIAFTAGSVDNPKVDGIAVAAASGTSYTLTVNKGGTGSGTVAGGAIDCGGVCSTSLASGTVVILTASPATGSTFAGWGAPCSGTGTCTVTMTTAQTVTATFTGSNSACTSVSGGQSGNFNTTGAVCFTVSGAVNGWGCSNVDGRTVTVNGTAATCGQLPLPGSSPYTFAFTAGSYPWASFYWW
jgi:glucuronoarabinoxylan endo-1,4-beta-xylanase